MSSITRLLVPVKKLGEAKTAFSEVLTNGQRRELTLAMLEDVLSAADRVEGVQPAVVTPDESVTSFVENRGTETVLEPDIGLNRALEIAIGESIDSGYGEVLIFPADVPLLRPRNIKEILNLASGDRSVVIAPSEENGTNALLLRPPNVIDLKFGGESFPKHFEEAQSLGISPRIYNSIRLERDIDTPRDLLRIETLGKGTNTHSFLDSLKRE